MEFSLIHRKIKPLVLNGGGDFKEYIKPFDVLVGTHPPETMRDLVRIVSKSIDASGPVFDYDKLTKIMSSQQLENTMKSQRMQMLENKLRKMVREELQSTKKNRLNEDNRWALELFTDIDAAMEELNECGRTLVESGGKSKLLGIELQKVCIEISRIAEQVKRLR